MGHEATIRETIKCCGCGHTNINRENCEKCNEELIVPIRCKSCHSKLLHFGKGACRACGEKYEIKLT